MTEERLWEWLTSASPGQFLLGIAILVFGSRQILSEKSLKSSLGGLGLPFKFLRNARENAAEAEANELAFLRGEVKRLNKRVSVYHRWAVSVTEQYHRLELWAAHKGVHLPPPPFTEFHIFESEREVKDDPEDSERRALGDRPDMGSG